MAREASEADRRSGATQRPRARRTPLIAYVETSAFVKLLVHERGAADVAAAWLAADRRMSSLLLYPEARAAVARSERMGRVAGRQLGIVRRRLDALWAVVDRIAVTETLARRAGDLAEKHGLRGYDAVHLASLEDAADPETVLVSADEQLVTAARSAGFAVAPV